MARKDANPGRQEAAAERREAAFRLRKLGLGYRSIGRRLGVSHVQAQRDVKSVLRELNKATRKAAAELRQLESERLDLLWARLMPKVALGDPKAVAAAVRIVQRRAALFGLDSPKALELSGKGGKPIAFRSTVKGMSLDQFQSLSTAEKSAILRGAMGLGEDDPS